MGDAISTSRQKPTIIIEQNKIISFQKELQNLRQPNNLQIQIDMTDIHEDVITLIEVFYRFKTMFDLIGPLERVSQKVQEDIELCQKTKNIISDMILDGVEDFHILFQKNEEEGYKFLAQDSKFFKKFYPQLKYLAVIISRLVDEPSFQAIFPISLPFFISGIKTINQIASNVDNLQQRTLSQQTTLQNTIQQTTLQNTVNTSTQIKS